MTAMIAMMFHVIRWVTKKAPGSTTPAIAPPTQHAHHTRQGDSETDRDGRGIAGHRRQRSFVPRRQPPK